MSNPWKTFKQEVSHLFVGRTARQTPLKLNVKVYEAVIHSRSRMKGSCHVWRDFLTILPVQHGRVAPLSHPPCGQPAPSTPQILSQALKSSSAVFCALLTATAWNCAIMASLYLSGWVCAFISVCLSRRVLRLFLSFFLALTDSSVIGLFRLL